MPSAWSGAIATNLGACSTDRKLGLARWERYLMFVTFLIMLAIEISLFVDKAVGAGFRRYRAGGRVGVARPGGRDCQPAKGRGHAAAARAASLPPTANSSLHSLSNRGSLRPAHDVRDSRAGQNAGFRHRRGAADAPSPLLAICAAAAGADGGRITNANGRKTRRRAKFSWRPERKRRGIRFSRVTR